MKNRQKYREKIMTNNETQRKRRNKIMNSREKKENIANNN